MKSLWIYTCIILTLLWPQLSGATAIATLSALTTTSSTPTSILTTANPVQVTELDLYDHKRQRPVKITLWYPAQTSCKDARICLAQQTIVHKAVVFSHGAMGAAKGYSWIGRMFAAQGYVTVGVNHYGESWIYGPEHVNPAAALQFWERPLDISFVLDVLQNNQLTAAVLPPALVTSSATVKSDPATQVAVAKSKTLAQAPAIFSLELNWQQIVAVGHSSGGATVLSMAGSKLDFKDAALYCATAAAATDRSCHYLKFQTEANTKGYNPAQDFSDSRIQSVIALDPALGHAATTPSLQAIKVPVLIIGSSQNDFLPYDRHAGYYAAAIPAATNLVFTQGEGHFVYLDRCKHAYQAMGVALCSDRPGIDRTQVHKKAGATMLQFIKGTAAL